MVSSSVWLFCFFFFKQKTAYEMRISDWSSDVCSSDLGRDRRAGRPLPVALLAAHPEAGGRGGHRAPGGAAEPGEDERRGDGLRRHPHQPARRQVAGAVRRADDADSGGGRTLQIGRASCRERGGKYVWMSVVAGVLK